MNAAFLLLTTAWLAGADPAPAPAASACCGAGGCGACCEYTCCEERRGLFQRLCDRFKKDDCCNDCCNTCCQTTCCKPVCKPVCCKPVCCKPVCCKPVCCKPVCCKPVCCKPVCCKPVCKPVCCKPVCCKPVCCKPVCKPVCCKPTCCQPTCCDSCCDDGCGRRRLLDRLRDLCKKDDCCDDCCNTCCQTTCCKPVCKPICCEVKCCAPTTCCGSCGSCCDSCCDDGCGRKGFFARLRERLKARKSCCDDCCGCDSCCGTGCGAHPEQIPAPKEPAKKMPQPMKQVQAVSPVQVAPKATITVDTGVQNPFELNRRYETRVNHDANYSSLTGQLFYVHADGGLWVLRYAPLWKEDLHGGSVVLARDLRMGSYREGDLVKVHGGIINSRSSMFLGGPLYQAQSIELIEREAK